MGEKRKKGNKVNGEVIVLSKEQQLAISFGGGVCEEGQIQVQTVLE